MISYDPLWATLQKRGITIYKLINTYNISRGTIDNLKHNRSITMASLNQLMEKLLNYSGSIFIDEDNDLLDEIEVEYATGRPQYIRYDANNDDDSDFHALFPPLLIAMYSEEIQFLQKE